MKPHDTFGLLDYVPKDFNFLDDVLGILNGDDSDELDTFVNGESLGNISTDTLLNVELTYAPAKKDRFIYYLRLVIIWI